MIDDTLLKGISGMQDGFYKAIKMKS